jgi:hypothetical protein
MPTLLKYFLIVSILLSFVVSSRPVEPPGATDDEGSCTTAVIAGSATANGRPMLWKNRDVSYPNQQVAYFNDGAYSYVTIITAGDTSNAWGGVNSVGFAIEDATNLNCPNDTVVGPDDDGKIIKLALRTCATVADFQHILDSTSVRGYAQPASFGVIDAAGGASIFETFSHSYLRYNASDSVAAPHGILVRANYSYAGNLTGRIGVYRHNRSKSLMENASLGDSLTPYFIAHHVARDLIYESGGAGYNPYPLPYQGTQFGSLPRGWVSTTGAICRRLSVSACIVEGVLPGEDPLLSTLYAFPMAVQYGVAMPFWVASRTTPPEVHTDPTAPLCDEGLRIKAIAQHQSGFHDTLDTGILVDGHGGGLHLTTLPLEARIFDRTDSALAIWRAAGTPDSAGMTQLTAQLASMAFDTLHAWPGPGDLYVPPRPVRDLTVYYVPDTGLRLRWSPVTQDTLGLQITPSAYSVWRYRTFSGIRDSIASTTSTTFVISDVTDSTHAFEVRAHR